MNCQAQALNASLRLLTTPGGAPVSRRSRMDLETIKHAPESLVDFRRDSFERRVTAGDGEHGFGFYDGDNRPLGPVRFIDDHVKGQEQSDLQLFL